MKLKTDEIIRNISITLTCPLKNSIDWEVASVNGCTWLQDNPTWEVSILIDKQIFDKITTGTKRCGFYNDGLIHGGPNGGEENQAGPIDNEQTHLTDNANQYSPDSMEVYNPRPNRRRRDADDLGNVLRANQSIR